MDEPKAGYGIRPSPGTCCPDKNIVDGKCTGCGHVYSVMDDINYPKIEIKNPPKRWWAGDKKVEPFMNKVNKALLRNNIKGDAKTDICNRACEAVYEAIKIYEIYKEENTKLNKRIKELEDQLK